MRDDNLISEEERDTVKLDTMRDQTVNKIENLIEEQPDSEHKKNSSFQTVFSIWNTMIGSSIVSIPYNVYYAGIIPTIFLGLLYGFVCYLTCAVVVRLGGKEDDFAVIVYKYLLYGFGPKTAKVGKIIQIIFNLAINTGATFIYFLIINQNLFPCICLFLKLFNIEIDALDQKPRFDRFSLIYCALIVAAIEFPLTILKELRLLSKFNSYGIYFVSLLLGYVIYTGIRTMAIDSFSCEYKENVDGSKLRYLYLFGESPGLLTGTLSLGLFSHSVILQLIKNNRKPENNQRDLFLGYTCVTLTYIIIGIFGYIGFSGSEYSSKFQGNWFLFFKSDNYVILVLRLLNVIQLSSIFPILIYAVRTQLLQNFMNKYYKSKSRLPLIIFSISILLLCIIVLYFCYDILPNLIGFVGAGTALVLVYTIAPLINMINYYIRHQPREELDKLNENKEQIDLSINQDELEPLVPWKAFIFYLSMMLIILLGIVTFILQCHSVNFFGIKIEKNK